jgi:hypothetical protein
MKLSRSRFLLLTACTFCIIAYIALFVSRFDIFGQPVHSVKYGWLGPAIRGDSHIVDIGSAYDYEGADISSYRTFGPLWSRS